MIVYITKNKTAPKWHTERMRHMNKWSGMGKLGKNPEIRYTSGNNTAIASWSLAVDRRFNKPGEERQTDWINCVAFGKTAEFVGKHFSKGQQIGIVGRIQTRTWDDTEGKKHYVTEVVAEEVYFAGEKKQGQQPQQESEGFAPVEDDDELPF